MSFYVRDLMGTTVREKRVVSTLSRIISRMHGAWVVDANRILSLLGYPTGSELILVQREKKPNPNKFKVLKFIGYTYQRKKNKWWAPLVIQGLDEENNLVHCFVYIVSEYPNFFAESGSYGPNLWPDALKTICLQILCDVCKHQP